MTRPGAVLAALLVLAAARAVAIDRATTLDGPWLFQPDPDAVGEAQGWEKPEADRFGRVNHEARAWSWADYRHRRGFTNGFPTEFGLFGLVTLDRQPKKAHAAMRGLWRAESE
jgi:hypothetical protein